LVGVNNVSGEEGGGEGRIELGLGKNRFFSFMLTFTNFV
jgi:hypothetical protein